MKLELYRHDVSKPRITVGKIGKPTNEMTTVNCIVVTTSTV